MPAARTTITAAEHAAYEARIGAMIDELDNIRKDLPVSPLWSALRTAQHAVSGVGQALLDLKHGNDRALTVVND